MTRVGRCDPTAWVGETDDVIQAGFKKTSATEPTRLLTTMEALSDTLPAEGTALPKADLPGDSAELPGDSAELPEDELPEESLPRLFEPPADLPQDAYETSVYFIGQFIRLSSQSLSFPEQIVSLLPIVQTLKELQDQMGPGYDFNVMFCTEVDPHDTASDLPKLDLQKLPLVDLEPSVRERFPECTICQQAFKIPGKVSRLQCQHIFHRECLFTWIDHKQECPLCKAPVSTSEWRAEAPKKPPTVDMNSMEFKAMLESIPRSESKKLKIFHLSL